MAAHTHRRWSAVGLVCALFVALALAACGGGDDSTSTQAPMPTATTGKGQQSAEKQAPSEGKSDAGGGKSGGSQEDTGGSQVNAAPLKVSGGGSAQFRVKGGDNSVQNYGDEAGESELQEVAERVHSFYVARVAEEWQRACSYLSAKVIEGFENLASGAPELKGKGCVGVLNAFTKSVPASLQRQLTSIDAAALRSEGEQGFLLYTGPPGKTVYSMPLQLEDGEWKLGAVSASALPGAKAP
jgi:hypothetical protein